MSTDHEFTKAADRYMERVLDQLGAFDPDELDCDLAMGVLSMEFADGTRCIMNRQTAAHQIWLAAGASSWHFAQDPHSGEWLDTKGRGSLTDILAQALSEKLGRRVALRAR
jgi:CyaY protein